VYDETIKTGDTDMNQHLENLSVEEKADLEDAERTLGSEDLGTCGAEIAEGDMRVEDILPPGDYHPHDVHEGPSTLQ